MVGGPLPEEGTDPAEVVADLARDVEPFITAHGSGRFFGFVSADCIQPPLGRIY